MATSWKTTPRRWALFASIAGFVMVSVYIAIMVAEGNNGFGEVAPWVVAMLLPTVLSLIAANTLMEGTARFLLLVSTVFFLAIGVLSIFSLGVGFLAAGAMALFAANELSRVRQH